MKAAWDRQEERTAKRYRGSRSIASGAGPTRKNDVRNETLLIENKTTGAKSYVLKAADLELLRCNASVEGRIPILQLDLGGRSYVILHEADFLDISGHNQ
jgi:hypothetical protein